MMSNTGISEDDPISMISEENNKQFMDSIGDMLSFSAVDLRNIFMNTVDQEKTEIVTVLLKS